MDISKFFPVVLIISLLCLQDAALTAEIDAKKDWPIWRGPTGDGLASAQSEVPVRWSSTDQVVWSTKVPGRGHASPTILGNRIFLATADENAKTQSVVAFDRTDGKLLWETVVQRGHLPDVIHKNNTHASPTVVTDGQSLYATFYHHDVIELAVLDLNGKITLQKQIGGHDPKAYQFGYAPSPALYKHLVIVASEYEKGWLAAFDKKTLKEVWRVDKAQLNFSSPVIMRLPELPFGGVDRVLISGSQVCSYNPATGQRHWAVNAPWKASCGTVVWDGGIIFASGGFPTKGTFAINSLTGKEVWINRKVKCYEQSLIAFDKAVYAFADTGVLYCLDGKSGQERWKKRLAGPVSASPVLVNGNLYLTNERGKMWVVKADKSTFQLLGESQLGEESFASPSIVDGRIYYRVARYENALRQEYLYCLGLK